MVTIYTEKDATPPALAGCRIAVLGYGSQGRAQALNLRDSLFDVVIGSRPGGRGEREARADGFQVRSPGAAAAEADLVALLVPDMAHRLVYENELAGNLKRGATLLVAHGFSIHYREIEPRHDIDVVLVAPQGSGERVRREFDGDRGGPCLFAVRQDATGSARARALAYVRGVGGAAAGAIETSFAEETETRLFGEQAARRGGAMEWAASAFDILVEAGYQPEVARFACLSGAGDAPDLLAGSRQDDDQVRAGMAEILKAIQGGALARDRIAWGQADQRQRTNWLDPQPEIRAA